MSIGRLNPLITKEVVPISARSVPPAQLPGMRAQPAADSPAEQEATRERTRAEIERSLEAVNRAAVMANERISFVLHDGSNRLMVQVINSDTGEVIREIPPKEILDAEAHIREMIGLFLNKKV